jgi:uncharacterized protein (DUF433 family)
MLMYNMPVVRNSPIRVAGQHINEYPTYTIPEAALFLGMAPGTLASWFVGRNRLLSPADAASSRIPLLSFNNVVEAYAIHLMRSKYDLSLQSIREALNNLPRYAHDKNPLRSRNLRVFETFLLYDTPRSVVNLTKDGQLAIPDVVDVWANRVLHDQSGKPLAIFPWRYWSADQDSKPVKIDPSVMCGRLVLTGTRIPVSLVAGRRNAGESIEEIASDYGLPPDSISKALQHLDRKAA